MASGGGAGQFAGSFADAFSRVSLQKQEQKQREELAKQRAKFVDLQMRSMGGKLDANTTMGEILAGSVEEFEPTAPVQTPTGETRSVGFTNESREPQNLIEALTTNPEFQSAAVQGGALNLGDLLDFQSGKEAREAFTSAGTGGNPGRTDAAGNLEFIDGPPTLQRNSDGTMSITQAKVPNPDFQSPVSAATGAQDVEHSITQVDNAMTLMASLEGTTLQSGTPSFLTNLSGAFQSTASALGAADFLGIDETAVQRRQRVKKLFADNLLSSEQLKILSQSGTVTDAKLAAVTAASADLGNGILANSLQMLDALEIKVENAEILGIPISDPRQALQQIEHRRAKITEELFGTPQGGTFFDDAQSLFDGAKEMAGSGASRAAQQAAAIKGMGAEALLGLHQSGVVLSDEARAAATVRLDELNKFAQESFNDLAPQVEAIGKMGLAQLQQLQQSGVTLAGETKKAIDDRWKELAPNRKFLKLKAAMEITRAKISVAKQISVIKDFSQDELTQLAESGLQLSEEVRAEAERLWGELDAAR